MNKAVERVLGALSKVKQSGKGWIACCPAHEDTKPSLSISEASGKPLLHCHAGCSQDEVIAALKAQGVWPDNQNPSAVTEYHYQNADGSIAYTIVRDSQKQFRAKTEKGWGLNGQQPIPYRLPELTKSRSVIVVEGEKDVHTVEKLGLAATTNPFGAGKWRKEYAQHFKGKRVVILPDNDEPGLDHAQKVAAGIKGVAESVRIVKLPVSEKGDVSDWVVGKDNARDELLELIKQAPEWRPVRRQGLVSLADVVAEKVEFLLDPHPHIPLAKLTFADGDPGSGKTYLSLAFAAAVSGGKGVPGMNPRQPGNTLLVAGIEDGLADTIRPRLDFLEADCSRITAVTEPFSFDDETSLDRLDADIKACEAVLVVIDPLSAYIGSNVDVFRDNQVRPILTRLSVIAESNGCSILCIRHLTKGSNAKALYRGQGSIGFIAAARSAMLVGNDPNDSTKHAALHIKHNLSGQGKPLGYQIDERGDFYWLDKSSLTEDELLGSADAGERLKIDDAVEFLRDYLSNGPVLVKKVLSAGKREGFSYATLRRANERIGILSKPMSYQGPRYWHLPDEASETCSREDRSQSCSSVMLMGEQDCKTVEHDPSPQTHSEHEQHCINSSSKHKKQKELVSVVHDEQDSEQDCEQHKGSTTQANPLLAQPQECIGRPEQHREVFK